MYLISASVNGTLLLWSVSAGKVNEVKGVSKIRRMPFRAALGMLCIMKYAGDCKTTMIQPKQLSVRETYKEENFHVFYIN